MVVFGCAKKPCITTVQVAGMQSHFIGAAFPQKFGAKKCPTKTHAAAYDDLAATKLCCKKQ